MDINTLAGWGRLRAWPIEVARKLIRRTPELAALGRPMGPCILLTEAEADVIDKALRSRVDRRRTRFQPV